MTHPGKIYAIGDVHGCRAELEDLLHRLRLGEHDVVVFVGDLVNRGPDSAGVVKLARSLPGSYALMGNHELRLLRYHETGDEGLLKDFDRDTIAQLGEADWRYLRDMRLTLHFPGLKTVIAHGGFLPKKPWDQQPPEVVTQIQVIHRKSGKWGKRAEVAHGTTWMKFWQGPPFVVCGHTPRRKVVRTKWSICIDTGCVYGGKLTAYELTEDRLVQVDAREAYIPKNLSSAV